MSQPLQGTAVEEVNFLRYTGPVIPWYVRLVWLGFWIFTISYVINYLLPALQQELTSPP